MSHLEVLKLLALLASHSALSSSPRHFRRRLRLPWLPLAPRPSNRETLNSKIPKVKRYCRPAIAAEHGSIMSNRPTNRWFPMALIALLLLTSAWAADPDDKLRANAQTAMRKAAEYYRNKVALRGGYVYYYSPDLKLRYGEGIATPTQIWVQPPGTPTVGLAYLAAYRATGDKFYLDAAREAGEALIYGQLKSGGWQNCIDFDPKGRVNLYRNGKGGGQNNSTLDDNISQSAIRFMARLDEALEFNDATVYESAAIALDALLNAQFANGAFPQIWTGPVAPVEVKKASYPDYDYRNEGKVKEYWNMFTLNDGLAGTVSDTLLTAEAV